VRVDAVSDIHRATLEADGFERPSDFDLNSFWQTWREEEAAARPPFKVRLRVRKDALSYVRDALGERRGVFTAPAGESEEWVEIGTSFALFDSARRALLALGGAVEVIGPPALRASMADFAEQIAARYNRPPTPPANG